MARKKLTKIDIVERYLKSKYDIRYNVISKSIQYQVKNELPLKWQDMQEHKFIIEIYKQGIAISERLFGSIIRNPDFTTYFDPCINYFKELKKYKKRGETEVSKLSNYITISSELSHSFLIRHLTMWLARCVKTVFVPEYYNKQCLVVASANKDIGKTHFCRWICPPPLKEYMSENFEFRTKDDKISLTTDFIILMDEIDVIDSKHLNRLKATMSTNFVKVRLPHDRLATRAPRIANFIATTNDEIFIPDDIGSVRWISLPIKAIDWKYSKEINLDKLWSEAYHYWKDGNQIEMDNADRIELQRFNRKFQDQTTEYELISSYFLSPQKANPKDTEFYTASDVAVLLSEKSGLRLSKVNVGKALRKMGFERIMNPKTKTYGYLLDKSCGENDYSNSESDKQPDNLPEEPPF